MNPKTGFGNIEKSSEQTQSTDDPNKSSADILLKTWKKGQRTVEQFWKYWRNYYLKSLRERTQLQHKKRRIGVNRKPSVGEVVTIKEEIPRGSWKIGTITNLRKSKDGQALNRVVISTGNCFRKFVDC